MLNELNLRLLVGKVEYGREEGVTRSNRRSKLTNETGYEISAVVFAGAVAIAIAARDRRSDCGIEGLHEHGAPADFEAPPGLRCGTLGLEASCLVHDVDLEGLQREQVDKRLAGAETDGFGDDFLELF